MSGIQVPPGIAQQRNAELAARIQQRNQIYSVALQIWLKELERNPGADTASLANDAIAKAKIFTAAVNHDILREEEHARASDLSGKISPGIGDRE